MDTIPLDPDSRPETGVVHATNRCVVCGKAFDSFRPDLARYCSYRCSNDAYIAWRREQRRSRRRKTCCRCGLPFEAKRVDAKHCSGACRQASYRQHVTDAGCGRFAATLNRNDSGVSETGVPEPEESRDTA